MESCHSLMAFDLEIPTAKVKGKYDITQNNPKKTTLIITNFVPDWP